MEAGKDQQSKYSSEGSACLSSNGNSQYSLGGTSSMGGTSAATEELSRNLSLALMGSSVVDSSIISSNGEPAPPSTPVTNSEVKPDTSSSAPTASTTEPSSVASTSDIHNNNNNKEFSTEAASSSSNSSTSDEEGETGTSKPSSSSSGEEDGSSSSGKKCTKKDRSKLRKGKWTVEEEEFTTRIIHHFSTGLLTLPEGATLRSFLADKLNCDPMRITKKFAGASCLGRRVFHLRNRPQPTYEEIQMARAELDSLEQRFRLRVEHSYGGMPFTSSMALNFATPAEPRTQPSIMAQPISTPSYGSTLPPPPQASSAAASAATTFLQSIVAAAAAANGGHSPAPGAAPATFPFPAHGHGQLTSVPAQPASAPSLASLTTAGMPPAAAAQWLLPNPQTASGPAPTAPAPPAQSVDEPLRAVQDAVTNWAWAQVAASLSNALPQLTAANLQQHQQQQQLMMSLSRVLPQLAAANLQQQPSPAPQAMPTPAQQSIQQHLQALQQQQEQSRLEALQKEQRQKKNSLQRSSSGETNIFAQQLRQAYESQLRAREQAEASRNKVAVPPTAAEVVAIMPKTVDGALNLPQKVCNMPLGSSQDDTRSKGTKRLNGYKDKRREKSGKINPTGVAADREKPRKESRSDEEQAAGSILMGFLSSLRDSYEDALQKKQGSAATSTALSDPSQNIKKRARREGDRSSKKQKLDRASTIANDNGTMPNATAVVEKDDQMKVSAPTIPQKALEESYRQISSNSLQGRRSNAAYITDMSTSTSETSSGNNSTNPVESSLEDSDSNSDKCGEGKDNQSSSEEDNKIDVGNHRDDRFRSKGPPRKRMRMKSSEDSKRNEIQVEAHQQQNATN